MDQRTPLGEVEPFARRVELLGYDGLNVPDALHDGLLVAQAALRATRRLRVATSVLVCFPRSPMVVAIAAWDLQAVSGGRFELGLGTQVRGNIERRYSTPWSAPRQRMGEYVESLRAIWQCFQHGGPLRYEGRHYRFTRLQPFFNPGPIAQPAIPVLLGAVGPKMTELAGRVSDGLMTHPTHSSPRFLREVTRPALDAGAVDREQGPDPVPILAGPLVATGPDAAEVSLQREHARALLGFLYSTPAYWRSLELFGWREIGERLHRHSRAGRWSEMAGAIDDEMLDTLVPQAPYDAIAELLRADYAGLATRINFPVPTDPRHDQAAAHAIAALRGRSQ
jgi:probable F420-dependent oxidoreductase